MNSKLKSRRGAFFVALSAGIVIALFLFPFSRNAPPRPLPIVIARFSTPHCGLIHIAAAKGYFAQEGLTAIMKTTLTGYDGIRQVLRNEADVASAAETPIARMLAQGMHIKVIATIYSSEWNSGLVARKDRGIFRPEDLRGKRIGFIFGTATHYEMETFLAFHNIPLDSVSLVSSTPNELVDALVSGKVDAAVSWMPYLTRMQQQLGDNGVTFSPKEFYSEMTNLVVRADYVKRNREVIDRLLRALLKAEAFAKNHPDEATRIVAAASGLDPSVLSRYGKALAYDLTLKQSLLLAVENEVRWHFRRGLVPNRPFPDVLDAFETAPLRALKPSRVTISK